MSQGPVPAANAVCCRALTPLERRLTSSASTNIVHWKSPLNLPILVSPSNRVRSQVELVWVDNPGGHRCELWSPPARRRGRSPLLRACSIFRQNAEISAQVDFHHGLGRLSSGDRGRSL